jgi:hypothetical protein
LESSLTLAKNKQAAELESLKVSLAALAAAQLSASQASAALTEREQQLAQKDEIQNQAVQIHEEALAELEASKKILAAREKTFAEERGKFEEAQKNSILAQALLAQESAELAAQRQAFLIEQVALTQARTSMEAKQASVVYDK